MNIVKTDRSRINEVDFENLGFGEIFADHMVSLEYSQGHWASPQIVPFGEIEVSPALASLHYGQVIFEGFKAFCAKNGSINIFRPDKHHERLNNSCRRLCIPEIDYNLFISGLKELIQLDRAWIPTKRGQALYIRPIIFATDNTLALRVASSYRLIIMISPVGEYYKGAIKLMTSDKYVRAVQGGLGGTKTAANYATSLLPIEEAKQQGCHQVLWLDGVERKYIEEAGMMNIFFLIADELITPPLEGTILPGVTRNTILHLARDWGLNVVERRITIDEVQAAAKSGALKEAFGAGTAAVVLPVAAIHHHGEIITLDPDQPETLWQKFYNEITDIQYGEKGDKFGWCYSV